MEEEGDGKGEEDSYVGLEGEEEGEEGQSLKDHWCCQIFSLRKFRSNFEIEKPFEFVSFGFALLLE